MRSTRRPATRIAGLAAIIFFACCAARSDARIAADEHAHFDPVRAIAAWYASTASAGAQNALADARAEGVVASAQSMLTTTKLDGAAGTPARVEPLRVETEIRMHRVYDSSPPEIRFSSYLAPGERRTVRGGERGVTWVTERVTSWNGVLVDRQVLSREQVRSARPELVLQGMPRTLAQLHAMTTFRAVAAALTMVATAYTANTATAYPTGYTATGILARQGIVAVDPHIIPLGSVVFIPGYGIALAADTGGAIIGNRIDLCFDSYGEAVNFGRQTITVYVLKR